MMNICMVNGRLTMLNKKGQSLVEFALLLPLFVLIIVGVFDLGRAFFAYIAISNAAREGARVVTFWPGKVTLANINNAVATEIGGSTVVNITRLSAPVVECGDPLVVVTTNAQLKACPQEETIKVTLTYTQDLILSVFFTEPLTLRRSAEMMVP
jgi:Flp pilus assembly protein TadG